MIRKRFVFLLVLLGAWLSAQEHPQLIMTKEGVAKIRQNLGKVPLFDAYLAEVKAEVDAEIKTGIHVPIPKDMAGGYTHERHKRNFFMLQKAGALYQILQEESYAAYVKATLLEYARIYKSLPIHPQPRSYARGKIFWQCLNDSNWLVYVSQAYDCIYDFLSRKERRYLEEELFRPYADYLSIGNPQFFNRIHNHSTWGNAAVGMIGLVMNDEELIERALYGLSQDNIDANAKDNDGGYIKAKDGKAGFLANIEAPFSPEGYYTEAPYYQRYAMYPYLLFAVGLHNMRPQTTIFNYKDGVLLKAVNTLLNLTDTDGEFYPLNDAQKGMSFYSRELVAAVDIAYHYGDQNPGLLSIAETQGQLTLDDAGFAVAKAVAEGKTASFDKFSFEITDGPEGKQGGITVLRSGPFESEVNLVSKYTAHGNSHGHYDKLSFSLFFKGKEVLQDYGLARFVNIDQKNGGGYLKENTTWAKQTLAHNTLVMNKTSHFNGDYSRGSQYHSEKYFSRIGTTGYQIISAKERNAYQNTELHRTMALIEDERLDNAMLLDVFKVTALGDNLFDLPFHYFGQLMTTSFPITSNPVLEPLGKGSGYQHLWHRASGMNGNAFNQISWFDGETFFTLSTHNQGNDEFLFTQLGANDPSFNLRTDPSLILRRKVNGSTTFIQTIETHGNYSPVSEIALNASSSIRAITLLWDTSAYTVVQVDFLAGDPVKVFIANQNNEETAAHQLKIKDQSYQWVGPYMITNQHTIQ